MITSDALPSMSLLRIPSKNFSTSLNSFEEALDLAIKGCHQVSKIQKDSLLKRYHSSEGVE